ncbi:hypothetical protein LXL04_009628 [Taraxacum kok-saghyz]
MATTKSVDASLWWDPFTDLLTELENLSPSLELPISLAKKLKENHSWLLDSVSLFKPPNQKSREAMDSQQVQIGSHQLTIQPRLKELAMKISSSLCLDEVQSYILVERACEDDTPDHVALEPLHLKVMLQYYIERQCILKCTRQILMLSLYVEDTSKADQSLKEVMLRLISDGLENKLLSVLDTLLSATYPDSMDVDVFSLWAEEMLIEDNLVLDILFLAYYESFCTCDGKQWKNLCLLYERMISGACNFGKLAISNEAVQSIYHAKVQLLLILLETLYLENLLQMVHDETPFREGDISFTLSDIQEVDAIISTFDAFETKESGPLILTWAVFLCLISSLPDKQEHNILMEIDHAGYVRQAFGAASLTYFDEILHSNLLKDSEGPIAGSRSVLRTFISAFIASYEISLQSEDNNLKLILNILGEIYQGEESLCVQFWDRDSFIDGPVRCLLYNLEGEFPFRTVELIYLLSALSEGPWPAECVYKFLHNSVGLSTLVDLRVNLEYDSNSRIVETRLPMSVPGLEGLQIPSNTRGHVLKFINDNTALVRWEVNIKCFLVFTFYYLGTYTQSGVMVLLLHVAQEMYPDGSEEVLATLSLFSRLVSFNKDVCYSLMNIGDSFHDKDITGFNVAEIICTLIKNLSPKCSGALMMSMGVNILAMMLNCCPSVVIPTVLKTNIFDVSLKMNPFNNGSDGLSSGSWLLSGRLAKLLLIDCEHNDMLEFTVQLLEKGEENDFLFALVIFCIQYVLVNHEYWKYKARHIRWKVTLKVLEFVKTCILSISHYPKMGETVGDLLLCDSSVHSALFRIVCITTPTLEKLYVSRLYGITEIEGVQLAICSVLDIFSMLSDLSKDALPGYPVFHQAVMSSATKPIPVVTAIISLISFFRNPNIQLGAVTALSSLLLTADDSQPYMSGNVCFGLDEKQIADFRNSIVMIISDESFVNEDLIANTFKMLASAAYYQPAFLLAIVDSKDDTTEVGSDSLKPKGANLLDAVGVYIGKSPELIKSNPKVLVNVMDFLMALWQGAPQYTNVVESVKKSGNFWKQLSSCISVTLSTDPLVSSYRYQCQSDILQIMSLEMFFQKKVLLHADVIRKGSESSKPIAITEKSDDSHGGPRDIVSDWCKNLLLSDLIKSYGSCEYDNDKYLKAQVSAALLSVQAIEKLRNGSTGSLSVSLVEKLTILGRKLHDQPAFSELITQYRHQGYREEKELKSLIMSDLYYHIQGEFEGRKVQHKLFKDLFHFLLQSNLLQTYQTKEAENLSIHAKNILLFDCTRLQKDLGLHLWDVSEWKNLKNIAETLLSHMKHVNSMLILSSSKLSALKAFTTTLPIYDEDVRWKATIGGELITSCIQHICKSLNKATESLLLSTDSSNYALQFLESQAELLLHFLKFVQRKQSFSSSILIIKTITSCLKPIKHHPNSLKLLLMTLLSSINSPVFQSTTNDSEVTDVLSRLLPILCNITDPVDHFTLSISAIDLVTKTLSTPTTWFSIIQEHLNLQNIIKILPNKNYSNSVPVVLKFLLTFARVKKGSEILTNMGFFSSLRVLLDENENEKEKEKIWGLGLAVVSTILHSLKDSSLETDILDYVISCFILEKPDFVSFCLNTPNFTPITTDKKKRARPQSQTTLTDLKETQHTLSLICMLAKHQNLWSKTMKEMDAELREKSIRLLAFISRGPENNTRSTGWFLSLSSKGKTVNVEETGLLSDVTAIEVYRIAYYVLKFLCVQADGAAKRAEEVGFVDVARFPDLPMPDILHGLQDQGIAIVTELCEGKKLTPETESVCILLLQITEKCLYLEFCVSQVCGIRPVMGRLEDFSKELKLLLRVTKEHVFVEEWVKSLKQIASYVYPGLLQTEGCL